MDRRRLGHDIVALVSPSLERRGVRAAFTERTGGVSPSPFESLNLGFRTRDAASRVRTNRERLATALEIDAFAQGEQVHGAAAAWVDRERVGAGFHDERSAIPGTDALIGTRRRTPVAVLVADCVPVVVAWEGTVAVVHAGWRGLAAGIVDRVLDRVRGGTPVAAVGPAIGPCHYEVDEDVAEAVTAGSPAGAVVERRRGRVFLDLPATVEAVLRRGGVAHVDRAGECTACHPERFFSHRRDGVTGRQAVVAWLA